MRGLRLVPLVAVLLLLAGCSVPKSGDGPVSVESPTSSASVSADLVGSAGTARFTSVAVSGDAKAASAEQRTSFQVWFDRQDGHLTLFANGPVNIYSVPVRIVGSLVTPDPDGMTGSGVGCAGDGNSDCYLDHWLSGFIAKPFRLTIVDDDLRLSSGTIAMRLSRHTGRAAQIRTNGRVLLTYPAPNGGNQALLIGVLGEDAAHCVTVGRQVIVVPDNARLLADGSLFVGGAELAAGKTVQLGGGSDGQIPDGSPCNEPSGRYFTVGGYPQPQSR